MARRIEQKEDDDVAAFDAAVADSFDYDVDEDDDAGGGGGVGGDDDDV